MGRQIIEIVQVLVDRIEDAAARQQKDWRYWEEEAERRKAAEKDRDHWMAARKDAIAAGELMQAEIETLRQKLAEAQQQDVDAMRAEIERLQAFVEKVRDAQAFYQWPASWRQIDAALTELDLKPTSATETEGGQ